MMNLRLSISLWEKHNQHNTAFEPLQNLIVEITKMEARLPAGYIHEYKAGGSTAENLVRAKLWGRHANNGDYLGILRPNQAS